MGITFHYFTERRDNSESPWVPFKLYRHPLIRNHQLFEHLGCFDDNEALFPSRGIPSDQSSRLQEVYQFFAQGWPGNDAVKLIEKELGDYPYPEKEGAHSWLTLTEILQHEEQLSVCADFQGVIQELKTHGTAENVRLLFHFS